MYDYLMPEMMTVIIVMSMRDSYAVSDSFRLYIIEFFHLTSVSLASGERQSEDG